MPKFEKISEKLIKEWQQKLALLIGDFFTLSRGDFSNLTTAEKKRKIAAFFYKRVNLCNIEEDSLLESELESFLSACSNDTVEEWIKDNYEVLEEAFGVNPNSYSVNKNNNNNNNTSNVLSQKRALIRKFIGDAKLPPEEIKKITKLLDKYEQLKMALPINNLFDYLGLKLENTGALVPVGNPSFQSQNELLSLPREIINSILRFLGPQDLNNFSLVSHKAHFFAQPWKLSKNLANIKITTASFEKEADILEYCGVDTFLEKIKQGKLKAPIKNIDLHINFPDEDYIFDKNIVDITNISSVMINLFKSSVLKNNQSVSLGKCISLVHPEFPRWMAPELHDSQALCSITIIDPERDNSFKKQMQFLGSYQQRSGSRVYGCSPIFVMVNANPESYAELQKIAQKNDFILFGLKELSQEGLMPIINIATTVILAQANPEEANGLIEKLHSVTTTPLEVDDCYVPAEENNSNQVGTPK